MEREGIMAQKQQTSRGGVPLEVEWQPWPKSLSGIGFSFKHGGTGADVGRRRNPDTELIEWVAIVWTFDAPAEREESYHGQDLHAALEYVEDRAGLIE